VTECFQGIGPLKPGAHLHYTVEQRLAAFMLLIDSDSPAWMKLSRRSRRRWRGRGGVWTSYPELVAKAKECGLFDRAKELSGR
jgi:hypothetical protein